MAKFNHRILVFFPTIYLAPLKVYTKFEDSGCNRAENSVTKNFIGKKNGQIKGMISSSMLILFYTIQQVIPNICTNFKILDALVTEKSLTQISLCITLE